MKHKKGIALLALVACFQFVGGTLHAGKKSKHPSSEMYDDGEYDNDGHEEGEEDNELTGQHKQIELKDHNNVDEKVGIYVFADFIYWNMQANGLVVATVLRSDSSISTVYPESHSRPGLKAGLGVAIPPVMMDLCAQYTWFPNDEGKTSYSTSTLTTPDAYEDGFRSAGGSVANNFNRFDLGLHKTILFGDHLAFKPGGGLVAIWGETWYNAQLGTHRTLTGTVTLENEDDYWGVGPYADVTSEFIIPAVVMEKSQWVFFMKGGTGFSWTNQKPTYKTTATGTITSHEDMQANFNQTYLSQVVDGMLGVKWETKGDLDDAMPLFSVQLAWDYQWWNELLAIKSQSERNSLALQGFTLGLSVKF